MPEHELEDYDHEADRAPTIARRRGARSDRPAVESQVRATADRSTASNPSGAPGGFAASGEEAIEVALLAEEATRLRGFSRMAMLMTALVGAQIPFLGGDPGRRAIAAVALLVMFALAVWGYVHTSRVKAVDPIVFRVQAWGLATCVLAVEHYVGFYSPMTVVLSLGIYHLAQANDRSYALLMPTYVVITWIGGALLTTLGVVPDVGLYRIESISLASQVLMITGVGCTLIGAIWLAQVARASARNAALEASRALLIADRRNALLQEAQHQLDHAMRVSIGKPGRHSGALAGGYRLDELIGIGAMGEVYAATHESDGRSAAVKLLHASALCREDHVARFLREAELCTRFTHPNVVRIYDVGRMPDGAPFMAMERLFGDTLSDVLRERGQLSMREVLELGDAAGAGLAHAHEHGVVHRDFKPHNVLAASDAVRAELANSDAVQLAPRRLRWTVLDFGISKPFDSTGTLTGIDGVVGTPSYMSPEQARGAALDARSDLFSLASVLYRALTGHPAFLGKDAPGIMFDVAYRMPERPSRQNESILPDVDLVFAIALAKEPAQRFGSAHDLMDALHAAAHGRLPESVRSRARHLLGKAPWGARITEPAVISS